MHKYMCVILSTMTVANVPEMCYNIYTQKTVYAFGKFIRRRLL